MNRATGGGFHNDAGKAVQHEQSLPLLRKAFEWARSLNPLQPLTAGLWYDNAELNEFQLAASDIITFHNYSDADSLAAQIGELRRNRRPMLCTEWLCRGHSEVSTCLPLFYREHVGCYNWGLVSGKIQTIYSWATWDSPESTEPAVWFHDLLRQDGSAFDPDEVRLFRQFTAPANSPAHSPARF